MSSATASSSSSRTSSAPVSTASPRKRSVAVLVYAVLIVVAIVFVVPFLWLLFAAFDPNAQLTLKVPDGLSLDNFGEVLTVKTTIRPMLNSLLLCGVASVATIVICALAAYPLSRYNLRFGKPFLYSVLFASGLPLTAVMVPVYGLFARANIIDSYWSTAAFLTATSLPIGIWLTKNFMDGVPVNLEEASWVDGATSMRSLFHIVAPLMLPGLLVVGIFTFVTTWGNFFAPFILLLSEEKLPAAVSIYTFFGQYGGVAYGQLAAYSLIYTLPVVVLYLVVSKWLGGAFALSGAVKG